MTAIRAALLTLALLADAELIRAQQPRPPIGIGEAAHGTIADDDVLASDGHRYDAYRLAADAGARVAITVDHDDPSELYFELLGVQGDGTTSLVRSGVYDPSPGIHVTLPRDDGAAPFDGYELRVHAYEPPVGYTLSVAAWTRPAIRAPGPLRLHAGALAHFSLGPSSGAWLEDDGDDGRSAPGTDADADAWYHEDRYLVASGAGTRVELRIVPTGGRADLPAPNEGFGEPLRPRVELGRVGPHGFEPVARIPIGAFDADLVLLWTQPAEPLVVRVTSIDPAAVGPYALTLEEREPLLLPDAPATRGLNVDDALVAELDASSVRLPLTSEPAALHVHEGTPGAMVRVRLSADFDHHLAAGSVDGDQLVSIAERFGPGGAGSWLDVVVPPDGRVAILVGSRGPEPFGRYRLLVERR